jgi:hypothetical protein
MLNSANSMLVILLRQILLVHVVTARSRLGAGYVNGFGSEFRFELQSERNRPCMDLVDPGSLEV